MKPKVKQHHHLVQHGARGAPLVADGWAAARPEAAPQSSRPNPRVPFGVTAVTAFTAVFTAVSSSSCMTSRRVSKSGRSIEYRRCPETAVAVMKTVLAVTAYAESYESASEQQHSAAAAHQLFRDSTLRVGLK